MSKITVTYSFDTPEEAAAHFAGHGAAVTKIGSVTQPAAVALVPAAAPVVATPANPSPVNPAAAAPVVAAVATPSASTAGPLIAAAPVAGSSSDVVTQDQVRAAYTAYVQRGTKNAQGVEDGQPRTAATGKAILSKYGIAKLTDATPDQCRLLLTEFMNG